MSFKYDFQVDVSGFQLRLKMVIWSNTKTIDIFVSNNEAHTMVLGESGCNLIKDDKAITELVLGPEEMISRYGAKFSIENLYTALGWLLKKD